MFNTENLSLKDYMAQFHESVPEFTMQKTIVTKTFHTSQVKTWVWNEIQRSRIKVAEMNYLYDCNVQRIGNGSNKYIYQI